MLKKAGKKAQTMRRKEPMRKAETKPLKHKGKMKIPAPKSWSVLTMKKHLWPTQT